MAEQNRLPAKPDGTKYRILIVDDAQFMIKTLQKMITDLGADVLDTACDGNEAVEKYKFHMSGGRPPEAAGTGTSLSGVDLVTLDITMPNKNGIEALKEIRALDPKARCVMVSAMGTDDYVKQAILLGAKHFIAKPFKQEKVYEVLKLILSRPV